MPLLSLLAFFTLINALAINGTDPDPSFPRLTRKKQDPLPNPYHVPGTRIELDFDDDPDLLLDGSAVRALLNGAQQYILQHIQQHGDGHIPFGLQRLRVMNVEMSYDSNPAYRMMLFSEVLAVIRGFRTKMYQEGYRERTAIVTWEGAGVYHQIETGEVDIGLVTPPIASSTE